jgi:hypothetical protein
VTPAPGFPVGVRALAAELKAAGAPVLYVLNECLGTLQANSEPTTAAEIRAFADLWDALPVPDLVDWRAGLT